MNQPIRVTATANIGTLDGGTLFSIVFTGGSDAATLILKEGGSGGTQIVPIIKAAAATTVSVTYVGGVVYKGQLHATITGTGPEAGFEIGI